MMIVVIEVFDGNLSSICVQFWSLSLTVLIVKVILTFCSKLNLTNIHIRNSTWTI